MTLIVIAPDERALRAHLDSGAFLAGVAAGRWPSSGWSGPRHRHGLGRAAEGAPPGFAIRFELTGYPTIAPTGCIWDIEAQRAVGGRTPTQGRRGRPCSASMGGLALPTPCTPRGTGSPSQTTPTGSPMPRTWRGMPVAT